MYVLVMLANVMVRACLNQEIRKISNYSGKILKKLLPEPEIYPKAECSEVPKCGLNTRHYNREVTLTHITQAQTLRSGK